MSEALYALLKQKKNVIKANLAKDPSATTERAGLIRIATLVEALKGIEDNTAITPHTLKEVGDKKFGASIGLDLDPETFQLTMSLINGAGETLSSETIDLPNENAIVDVDYDNSIKSLIFTYQNEETKTVSIEHLIDGLQAEITPSNMLSSDLVDDTNKQHKFVTPEERQKLDDTVTTATELNQLHESNVVKADLTKLHDITVSANDINQLSNIESNVQSQLDNKLELNSLSIKSDSTNYLGYDNTNGQISAKVDTTVTQNSTKLITSGGVQTAISNAQSADNTYADNAVAAHNESSVAHADIREDISDIEALIPEQATTENQLADKEFVNSSIATNTANFIGTFSSVTDLRAYSGDVTNNDYAFVINSTVTDNGNDWATFAALDTYDKTLLTNFDYAWVINGSKFDLYRFDIVNQIWESRAANIDKDDISLNNAYNRYKATVHGHEVQWDYEYTLNNSSFTADQWIAINSNITPELTAQITTNKNNIETIQGDYVPKSRTVNGKALSSNIALNANDVNALPASTTINDLTTEAQQNALNSTATKAKIDQIATNTTNIASNTSDISTINGKIPSNASTTNKMTTANDLSNAVANFANKDLANLSTTGNEKLRAIKGYEELGGVLEDTTGYSDVKALAYSTFDLSKFTVVGSPVVTDNGIASVFSSSNYLTVPKEILNSVGTNSWSIEIAGQNNFAYSTTMNTPNPLFSGSTHTWDDTTAFFMVGALNDNPFWFHSINLNVNGVITRTMILNGENNYDIIPSSYYGKDYKYTLSYDAPTKTYTSKLVFVDDNQTYTGTLQSDYYLAQQSNDLIIGYNYGDYELNLKSVVVKIDGVPVFSGNKTGVDTIKADDWTIPSGFTTPTIDNNGFATFATNNVISKTFTSAYTAASGVDFVIEQKINYTAGNTSQVLFSLLNGSTQIAYPMIDASGGSLFFFYYAPSSSYKTFTYTFVNGNTYNLKFITDFKTYVTLYINGILVDTQTFDNSANTITFDRVYIGNRADGARPLISSSDLSLFEFYDNAGLVYQPCLKIPYTEIKEGGKVTNALYRNRVLDAFQQNYTSYSYYTINETNQNYTLPAGNIYSLIESKRASNPQNTIDIDAITQYSALETGSLSTNLAVYDQLVKRKYSNFDASKFTVVGSPNITDDGIASGFSSSNYLTKSLTVTSTDTLRVETEFTYNTLNQYQRIIYFGTSQLRIMCSESGVVGAYIGGGTAIRAVGKSRLGNPTDGALIRVVLEITATTADFWVYVNDILKYHPEQKTGQTYSIASSVVQIGAYGGEYFASSIDLKQFSITVDGIPVFSGNKTGVDTVYSGNYSPANTTLPTISTDGIASSFTGSNFIKLPSFNFNDCDSWEMYIPFTYSTTSNGGTLQQLFRGANYPIAISINSSTNKLGTNLSSNGTSWDILTGTDGQGSLVYENNKSYLLKVVFTGSKYGFYVSQDNGQTYTTEVEVTSSTKVYGSTDYYIGCQVGQADRYWTGSIDLAGTKIIKDNKTAYRPMLLIPYTEAKTGSKIVDSVYRDSVADMYGQYGYAPYYTLNEDAKNFTLPHGDIYGMMYKLIDQIVDAKLAELNQ